MSVNETDTLSDEEYWNQAQSSKCTGNSRIPAVSARRLGSSSDSVRVRRGPHLRMPSEQPSHAGGNTSSARSSQISQAFRRLSMKDEGVAPLSKKRSINEAPLRLIIISDSESDDEDGALTDTESLSSSASVGSIWSPPSLLSSFSSVESGANVKSPVKASSPWPRPNRTDVPRQPLPIFSGTNPSGSELETTHLPPPQKQYSSPSTRDIPQMPSRSFPASGLPSSLSARPNPSSYSYLPPTSLASPTSESSAEGLKSYIGVDLNPFVVAHDREIQRLMDQKQISWGVQYELARGVSVGSWGWDSVRGKLDILKGCNAEVAFRVASVMRNVPLKIKPDLSIWRELDREQLAILENRSRGLGLMGPWEGDPDWYGGRVQQLARLVRSGNSYAVHLDPLEKRRSHHFARYLGSRRMIQLRIPDEIINKENSQVKDFLCHKFILLGRVFVAFLPKDNSVYLVETNENWERDIQVPDWCGDRHRLSFSEFIDWHNPLDLNQSQPIRKWSTRFAIGLSNSIPAVEVQDRNIFYIADEYACDWDGPGKPPAEKIMTDGCGYVNPAFLLAITRELGYTSRRTAVQGRFDGAKGLWFLHPTDDDPEPRIWIRESQNKIHHYDRDQAHRIFHLLAASQPSPGTQLSTQSILNLSFNGIPDGTLATLLVDGLTEIVSPLVDWDKPHGMEFLWNAINKLGHVSGSRMQRLAASVSRALGLQGRDWGHVDVGTEEAKDGGNIDEQLAPHSGRNQYSGASLALHETALELVQAGFHPSNSKYLRDKIRCMIDVAIQSAVEKYHIPLSQSQEAFIIADPLGVLKEGEIYYRSSVSIKDPETDVLYDVVTGEVVLGKYPIRLPSDMQKVTAVDVPELRNWPDVIIASIQGTRSLASLLGGGDYDGDTPFVIRDPIIVQNFQNQPFTPPPKDFIKDNFGDEKDVESVSAFKERIGTLPTHEAAKQFQGVLLFGLDDAKVGIYSVFHDYAVWKYGYSHERTVRLAYVFATLLDASKTGLRLKDGIFDLDRNEFNKEIPKSSDPVARRHTQKASGTFILHTLFEAGKAHGDRLLHDYDKMSGSSNQGPNAPDSDLRAPYAAAMDHAFKAFDHKFGGFVDEMKLIRAHVDKAYDEFLRATGKRRKALLEKKGKKKSDKQEDPMLLAARMFSEDVEGVALVPNVRAVKASYAFHRSPNFAFCVAFRDLCLIKAIASPSGIAPTARAFDEIRAISAPALRALVRNVEDRV